MRLVYPNLSFKENKPKNIHRVLRQPLRAGKINADPQNQPLRPGFVGYFCQFGAKTILNLVRECYKLMEKMV